MTLTNSTGSRGARIIAVAVLVAAAFSAASCNKPKGGPGGATQAGGASAARPGASGGQGGPWQGGAGAGGNRRSAIIPVQAMVAKIDTLVASRSTAGVIVPMMQSQVATQVAGVVRRMPHNPGDWVKAGDVIAELEDAQLRISLSTAQIVLQNAQINFSSGQSNSDQAGPKLQLQLQSAQSALDSATKYYESQKALFALGGITASQLDTASSQLSTAQANLEAAKTALSQNQSAGDQSIAQLKLAVDQAQNQVDQAKLNLANASVRAPFAGQIAVVSLQPGMYASLNTAVLTLVSSDRKISFNVSPSDAPYLAVGAALTFESGGKKYTARIQQAPSAPVSGVVPMAATVSGQPLPFGTVGNIDYSVPLARGAIVPIAALSTLEDQTFVFTIDSGRAAVKNVTIVAESGVSSAVDGLVEGDVVIVNPPPGLLQGSQVQPTMAQAGSASPTATPPSGAGGAQRGAAPQGSGGQGYGGRRNAQGGQAAPGGQASPANGNGQKTNASAQGAQAAQSDQGGQAAQAGQGAQGGRTWQGGQGGQGAQGGQSGQSGQGWQGGAGGQGGRRSRPSASSSPSPSAQASNS